MKNFVAILYLLCASLISLWCAVESVAPPPSVPQFEVEEPCKTAELLFVGDVMAHLPQVTAAKSQSGYDFTPCFRYVKPIFNAADCVVAKLETTLAATPPYTGYPCFKAPAELATALADAGVDVAVTANNHSLDAGAEGVRNTLDILNINGIAAVGTTPERVLRTTVKGIDFAILAYTYGTNGIAVPHGVTVNKIDTLQMRRDLEEVADADCRITFLHWGAEYSRRPSREQQELAEFLHRAGCQVVIGSHPHVVQRAECNGQSVTVYSLGNFISNQRMRYSDGGIMAKVRVEKCTNGCQFWLDIEPVWVRASDYTVIPYSVANQIGLSRSDRAVCDLFFDDTHKIFR